MKPSGRGSEWIYGRRPVMEVLRAERRQVYEAVLPPLSAHSSDDLDEIRALLRERRVVCKTMERNQMDRLCHGGNHQSVALRTDPYPYVAMEEALAQGREVKNPIYLVLDHLEDPQNVGSLLRTADAAGVTAVILPGDRSSGVTPAAVRASAGASEHLCVARVVNVTRAMQLLKEEGVWLTGLDMEGPKSQPYSQIDFTGPVGLVIGAEGNGLSRLVRDSCDFIATLPMNGAVASLNAAIAGAITLYEIVRQRGAKR